MSVCVWGEGIEGRGLHGECSKYLVDKQGRTDNSWGPRAIGDHRPPVSLPKLKKAYEKGTRGISWGPLLTPGPQAVPEFSKWSVRPCRQVYIKEIYS
ncbi:unnamed protein product, partial [Staurois parvus]